MIILTHCGKLGDFVYSWPIASWLYKTTGEKIHWVLAGSFTPFHAIERLAFLQEFTGEISYAGHLIKTTGCGGQPYRFNPADYGFDGEYYNLGFRDYPDKFVTEFQGEEHGFDWDRDWILDLGECEWAPQEDILATESPIIPYTNRIDLREDVYANAVRMKKSIHRHAHFSSMAAVLYFARLLFVLYREQWQPKVEYYFPDSTRIDLRDIPLGVHPNDHPVRTKWILMKEEARRISGL